MQNNNRYILLWTLIINENAEERSLFSVLYYFINQSKILLNEYFDNDKINLSVFDELSSNEIKFIFNDKYISTKKFTTIEFNDIKNYIKSYFLWVLENDIDNIILDIDNEHCNVIEMKNKDIDYRMSYLIYSYKIMFVNLYKNFLFQNNLWISKDIKNKLNDIKLNHLFLSLEFWYVYQFLFQHRVIKNKTFSVLWISLTVWYYKKNIKARSYSMHIEMNDEIFNKIYNKIIIYNPEKSLSFKKKVLEKY